MITPPTGWTTELRQSGLIVMPPEGIDGGLICYRDQQRPLRPVAEIVASLPVPDGWEPGVVSEIERLVTVEGEHAALVTVGGTIDGAPAERAVGVVYTDAFYTVTIGLALRRDQFARFRAVVRDLVVHDTFMLGTRRRRFVHAEPAGWQGFFVGPMHTRWLPIDYPRDAAMLTVFPALPIPTGACGHAEAFVRDHAARIGADCVLHDGLVVAASGLSGGCWRVVPTDAAVVHDIVVLEDGRYLYPVMLETVAGQREANLAVLTRLVSSIEPVPDTDRSTTSACARVFTHWIT